MRPEQEIFDDLATLCSSQGFIHAVAAICFRDNTVFYKHDLRAEIMANMYSKSRLIRSEVTTLIGLMMRAPIDLSLPAAGRIADYIERAEALLGELHQSMANSDAIVKALKNPSDQDINPFTFGTFLREPIFYGGESAYSFQYRDLAPLKYSADASWLIRNKNIDLEVGRDVCRIIAEILNKRLMETLQSLRDKLTTEWTILPGFSFSCNELAIQTNQPINTVRAVVEAFTVPEGERNATFTSLHAFNSAYAYPIIRAGTDKFILLQSYGITEALYETPYYWMCSDKSYAPTALRHRGEFTEAFALDRLKRVFGDGRVYQNVEIRKSKSETLGEIDVLVIYGNRIIVLQAKSKKLTLEARKGNDRLLQSDFKSAVQDAVDQAIASAELIAKPSVILISRDGSSVPITERPRTIFPVTIVADHYPALAFQARQFLKTKSNDQILPPLVTDVFALDAITEMLDSPLRLLSYLALRARFGNRVMTSHELVLLSYHLKHNLWIKHDLDLMMLDDDLLSDLDVAMAVRRDGVSGAATPNGILTRFEGTHYAKIITEIEGKPTSAAIGLGLMLLELREDTVAAINTHLGQVLALTAADGGLHDMTIGISSASAGLTAHCSHLTDREAENRLRHHCEIRKYSQKANTWFGLAIRPGGSIQVVVELTSPWKFNPQLQAILANGPSAYPPKAVTMPKVGRNDPCPCGSGKKYKYCCIHR